ncbi:MAG: ATP-binding protein [Oscillatoria sp. PMC 1051.18]|nr:ATP-binding protein [Oscillatoria sp. PMC 1050.18]MEC5029776.1 ATP-binding protein [Oscillatoria sp. PMC 1051.18]
MPSIQEIIQQEVNPFDSTTLYSSNFWREQQNEETNVNSIHQDAIATVEKLLAQVAKDNRPRSLILTGDVGSGKSYLLGRLKKQLNPKAFFAYIGPWSDSDYIWRPILRQTVDSLLHVPEGQEESQLLLWLKGLSAFKNNSFAKKIMGEERLFIKNLQDTYPTGIYNSKQFFKVLYRLTKPELYHTAQQWLYGNDLDEDDLKILGVKSSNNSEYAAKNILGNFGFMSRDSQPIVLCFDQLDNIPRLNENYLDLQPLFNVNTTLHNQYFNSFLIIISLVTNTWRQHESRIQSADKARVNAGLFNLKPITLDQVESLWEARLFPLHAQAHPRLKDNLFPLSRKIIEEKFPRGKTLPRNALTVAKQEYQKYKDGLIEPTIIDNNGGQIEPDSIIKNKISDPLAEFKLIWQKEYQKTQAQISEINLLPAPELIRMLQETLSALEIKAIKPKLLSGKSSINSFSYQHPQQNSRVGIVWTEDANMKTFYSVMKACEKVVNTKDCQNLYLIRNGKVGKPSSVGNKIYRKIFSSSPHFHLGVNPPSVHKLATYHNLVNSVSGSELVINNQVISLQELEALTREAQIFNNCKLLQDLKIISEKKVVKDGDKYLEDRETKEFVLNIAKTQGYLARKTLEERTLDNYGDLDQTKIGEMIEQLCHEEKLKVINPQEVPEKQLISYVP